MLASSLHILDILFRKCVLWCNGVMIIYTDCDFPHYTHATRTISNNQTGAGCASYTEFINSLGKGEV